jgi:antitoxin HicB
MAKRMRTSRSQVERLLDPNNKKVSYEILERAAEALGGELRVELK